MALKVKLPPLPDFILEQMGGVDFVEVAHRIGFRGPNYWNGNLGGGVGDDGTKTPSQTYFTSDLKSQIASGNHEALTNARNANLQDLQPNLTTIQMLQAQMTPSLCASDTGWMWTFITQISYTASGDKTKTQCVVQSGSYSKTGKILGLSYQTLNDVPTEVTTAGIVGIVSSFTFYFLRKYIIRGVFEEALADAVAAAEAEAIAGGFMVSEAAVSIMASVMSGLAAGVIGFIVAVIIYYLADFLHRSYGVTISVYNWDTESTWEVDDWYGGNAAVSQETKADGPWRKAILLPVKNHVPGPNGFIPTAEPVAQYASYSYTNDNKWLEGLGVAMSVRSGYGSFYFGYEVRRFLHNIIALSVNQSKTISQFYNDTGSWRPSGDYTYSCPIDGTNLSVAISTSALDGDRAYNFDVHIGIDARH